MRILISGKPAYIPSNISFEYIVENSLFSGADAYTLTITFPLKDCPQNLAIFGHLNRPDITKKTTLLPCQIIDRHFRKTGSLTITEINETEVKCQFLEGRSVLNYYSSFDDIYINTLTLPYPSTNPSSFAYTDNRSSTVIDNGYVALPWVNNLTGNIQNRPDGTSWHADTVGLTFQPYLWYLLSLIFNAINYTADLSALTATKWKYLLVCNALPYAWDKPSFAAALPNWTLTELLEQIEYLTNGEFIIDHSQHTITFAFAADAIAAETPILLDHILSEHTVEIADDEVEYRQNITLEYAENASDTHSQYYNCPWLIQEAQRQNLIKTYSTMSAFATAWNNQTANQCDTAGEAAQAIAALEKKKLIYIEQQKTYYLVTAFTSSVEAHGGVDPYATAKVSATLQQVNIFPPLNERETTNVSAANKVTLNIVPAWLDEAYITLNGTATSLGFAIFLDLPEYDNQSATSDGTNGLLALQIFNAGNTSDTTEFLDRIYVAFYNNDLPLPTQTTLSTTTTQTTLYSPVISPTVLWFNNKNITLARLTNTYSLRLHQAPSITTQTATTTQTTTGGADASSAGNDTSQTTTGDADASSAGNDTSQTTTQSTNVSEANQQHEVTNAQPQTLPSIAATQKHTFRWLSDTIPSVRAIYHIRGKRYLCAKITATFTANGMSQLLKGDFYPIT